MATQPCRTRVFGVVVTLLAAGSAAAGGPQKPLPKLPPLPAPKSAPRPTPRTLPDRATQRAQQRLEYKFTPGQTFAYRMEIRSESPDRAERFTGTPVVKVHSILKDGTAELGVVGRLSRSGKPGDDVWLSSFLKVPPNGPSHGKDDLNAKRLPGELHLFTKPSQLLFMHIPKSVDGEFSSEGGAFLSETKTNGFIPTFAMTKGRDADSTRSELESGSVYRITRERRFRTTEGTPREWRYKSTSRFDKDRGLILSTEGSLAFEENGKKSAPVKFSARLLDGDKLAQAKQQSLSERAYMPAELEPHELKRVRLDLKRANRFKKVSELEPGMAVAHFNDNGYQWYEAEVVRVVDEYKVKVRYRGSNEEFEVHPGQCAPLPAETGRRQ